MAEQTYFSGTQGFRPISSFGGAGTATGRIVIDVSQLDQAVAASQRASTQIQNAFGGGLQRNIQSAGQAVVRQSLQISAGLEHIARSTAALSAAGTALTVFGVAQAQRLQRVNQLMRIFSGSNELAEQRLSSIRDMAERTGRSYVELAEGALAILPAVGRANVDLEKTLSLVQRLALIDPAQGIEGASLAIRELLGGQTRSLVARFEMSATQLDALMDSAGGDPQRVLDGLDEMVSAFGLTDAAMQEMGDSGVTAFNALRGAAEEAAATGFNDFLKSAQTSARAMADWLNNLRETQPEVLRFAAGAAVTVAAIAPLAFIISKIVAAFTALITVISSPILLTVLGALGLVAGTVAATTAFAQHVANQGIGDQRLRTDSGENPFTVLFERLKQSLFSIVALFTGAGIDLRAVFEKLSLQLALGGMKLQLAWEQTMLDLLALISGMVASFYERFSFLDIGGVAGSLRESQSALQARSDEIAVRRDLLQFTEALGLRLIDKARGLAYETLNEGTLKPLLNILFPAAGKGQAIPGKAGASAEAEGNALERLTSAFGDALEKAAQYSEAYATESASIIRDFKAEAGRLLQDRSIADARQVFDDALTDTRSRRDWERQLRRSDSDFWGGLAKQTDAFNQQVQSDEAKSMAARARALAEFQAEQTKRQEEHLRRIADIEKSTLASVAEAALRLDASGVTRAFRQGTQQLGKENEGYDRDRAEREAEFNRRVEETRQAFASERNERLAAFGQQQADQIAQFQLQRARQLEDYALQRADLAEDRQLRAARQAEDRALEDQRRQQAHQDRLTQLAKDIAQEMGLWDSLRGGVAAAGQVVRDEIGRLFTEWQTRTAGARAAASAMTNAYAYQQQRQAAASAINNAYTYQQQRQAASGVRVLGTQYGGALPPNFPRVPTFASGGIASGLAIVGERGPELAQFTQPTRIYDANDTRQMLKGQETNVHIGSFAPVFGDIGNRSREEVIGMIDEALYTFFSQGAAARHA